MCSCERYDQKELNRLNLRYVIGWSLHLWEYRNQNLHVANLLALAHFPSWICRYEFVIRHKDYQHDSTSSAASTSSPPPIGWTTLTLASPHPIKKLSVSFSRVNYYLVSHPNTRGCAITILQQMHPIFGAAPLHRYTSGFNFLGSGYVFPGLVDLFSSGQWIYFLRL